MKKEIHPDKYRPVLFVDNSSGEEFIISSTVKAEDTGKAKDGREYPLVRVEISSSSHPFYTGEVRILDTAGRVERFKQKQAKAKSKK